MIAQVYEKLEKHNISEVKLRRGRLILCKDIEFGDSYTLSYREGDNHQPMSRYFSFTDLKFDVEMLVEEFGLADE